MKIKYQNILKNFKSFLYKILRILKIKYEFFEILIDLKILIYHKYIKRKDF